MPFNSRPFEFYLRVLKETIIRFFDRDMPMHAAALSYYMVFSLPSMLLIILWTSAHFYDEVAVREAIFAKIGALVGHHGARQIMATLEKLSVEQPTFLATGLGLAILLFFATSVFDAMRTAFNKIAGVRPDDTIARSIWKLLRIRFIAFALLISGEAAEWFVAFDFVLLELATVMLLFAIYFRHLPDITLKWRDVWLGALLTAGVLVLGKSLIGFFISNSTVADLYDAAGSLLVLMLWVYYSSAILLLGTVFTFTRVELMRREPDEPVQAVEDR
jgi:membrane protein